jgi:hypothetical protein
VPLSTELLHERPGELFDFVPSLLQDPDGLGASPAKLSEALPPT